MERTPLLRTPAGRAPSVLRTVPLVRPASRPLTPAWRVVPTVLPVLRGLLLLERTELLLEREGLLNVLLDERLGLLNELLRDDEELLLRLLLIELWLPPEERLLLIELLWLPPPPRLPPPRCANAGVALSARAIITSVITFEVFMLLLLSFFGFVFCCKNTTFLRGKFRNRHLFFPINLPSSRG